LEEAAFVNPNLFFRVIVPIHTVNDTALIAISTPDDEFNYFSKLLELKRDDKGTPLFLTLQVRQVCDPCREARKRCRHYEDLLPPWRSAKNQKVTEQIMKSNPDLYAREMLGVVRSNDTLFVFDPKLVDAFYQREPYRFSLTPGVVWVGIDPSGGGSLSNYAIVSMAFERGQNVVCSQFDGVDSQKRDELAIVRVDEFPSSNILSSAQIEHEMSACHVKPLRERKRAGRDKFSKAGRATSDHEDHILHPCGVIAFQALSESLLRK